MPRRSTLLAVSAAALALALPASASAAACADVDALPGSPAFTANAPSTTLCLLNNERAAAGLAPLRLGPAELEAPAVAYAHDMVDRKFFGHESPDGVKLLTRLAAYTVGPGWTVGENLAWGEATMGTPSAIVRAWMNSPGHRRNILDGSFKEIGIGIVPGAPQAVSRPAATYVTEFGARSGDAVVQDVPVAGEPTGSTAGKRSSSAKRKPRCRKVFPAVRRNGKVVRRNGKVVRVKKYVCPRKKGAKSSTKRATRSSTR